MSRTGIGYDSHRFGPGSSVRLGGVTIPFDRALTGHSDGDAVAHAVTDAVLGAAGAGDIGTPFPRHRSGEPRARLPGDAPHRRRDRA